MTSALKSSPSLQGKINSNPFLKEISKEMVEESKNNLKERGVYSKLNEGTPKIIFRGIPNLKESLRIKPMRTSIGDGISDSEIHTLKRQFLKKTTGETHETILNALKTENRDAVLRINSSRRILSPFKSEISAENLKRSYQGSYESIPKRIHRKKPASADRCTSQSSNNNIINSCNSSGLFLFNKPGTSIKCYAHNSEGNESERRIVNWRRPKSEVNFSPLLLQVSRKVKEKDERMKLFNTFIIKKTTNSASKRKINIQNNDYFFEKSKIKIDETLNNLNIGNLNKKVIRIFPNKQVPISKFIDLYEY